MVMREERRQETRERLLQAAARAFARRGYSNCTVADISREAGMSQGALYVHFRDKEELFLTMIAREHGQGADKAREALAKAPYLQGIFSILESCIRDVGFPVDHALWTDILAVAARDEAVRKAFMESDALMRAVFCELLHKAAAAGEIASDLDIEAVALWLYALVDGLIARTAIDADFNFARFAPVFVRLVRNALRPAPAVPADESPAR